MDEINKKHKGKYFMKILIIILIMLPTIILNSCTSAKRSSDVQIARVSSVPYLKMTCAELGTERRIVLERLDAARSKVDSEYDSEKATELVTWLLFAPAAFFLQGNAEEQAEFSQAKGTYDAIEEARKVNKCDVASNERNNDDSKVSFDEAVNQCEELGLDKGTDKFTDCVFKLNK